jgi:2-oxoisovalerate dehydrogenase E1 component beta subunit
MIDAPLGDRTKWKAKWPNLGYHKVEIGKARKIHNGDHATVVTFGRQSLFCEEIAKELEHEGIYLDVIDLRSIYPYDWKAIQESVGRTGRVLFVNEDTEVTNFAEHLSYRVTSELFYELMARPRVLAGKNVPGIGLHPNLEENTVPEKHQILHEIRELLAEQP